MDWEIVRVVRRWFDPAYGPRDHYVARWLFLRALGLIYFSAFYSLLFQIRGLIGPQGILPAADYLPAVTRALGPLRFWFAPTLLWFSSGSHMVMIICWVGILASLAVTVNLWPRASLLVCFVCFLSFVCAAQDFSSYQSDGMLLEAGFISLFFAPAGFLPGWGVGRVPARASMFLLLWEWFRIYFESGVVKLASGDLQWRTLTAMDQYYQNAPLPTWIGWYVEHLSHWFHAATVVATLGMELALVWMMFLPRRWRVVCFFIVTPWQIVVILTGNYAFLNYIVLVLGFLLLDDQFLVRLVPVRWRASLGAPASAAAHSESSSVGEKPDDSYDEDRQIPRSHFASFRVAVITIMLAWIFYAATLPMLRMFWREIPLPNAPVEAVEPFRIANQYGLFAVMTRHRYEIEFQGSNDGQTWTAYPFRYKPQDVTQPPGIYAPYQPRFEWNLWFASLGSWSQYQFVPRTEELLLTNDPDVLELFQRNPFPGAPPREVRAVLWQYWFSTMAQKRNQGIWWRRQLLGTYAPTLGRAADGQIGVVELPTLTGAQE